MHQNTRRRIGLIGHGRIGRAVANALVAGQAGAWELAAVLTRSPAKVFSALHHCNPVAFFSVAADLYIECAGPEAMALHGEEALQRADVWSVSGVALADDALRTRLEAIGARCGHRLRLVAGAAGGLDALQAMAVDANLTVDVAIVTPERCEPLCTTVREAAVRLPHSVNLAVAIALAGPGMDRTTIRVTPDPENSHHAISLAARSAYGSFHANLEPITDASKDLHIVAASLIAALRQASSVIWVG